MRRSSANRDCSNLKTGWRTVLAEGHYQGSAYSQFSLCVNSGLLHFLSQAPLFEMDQEEDEEEDVFSMKSRGKEDIL